MFIYTLGILDILKHPILNLFLGIDIIIYGFISKLYQVFVTIAEARFFQAELFQTIANRLYIIIGVVMLFVVAYSLLKAIINPDNFTKGDYSAPKIITNIILAIVLIAIVPTVFNLAYQAQGLILKENVIGKIIIGGSTDTSDDTHLITDDKAQNQSFLKEAGNQMLVTVFRAFYAPRVQTTNPDQDPAELVTADVSSYFDAGIFQVFDIMSGDYNWKLSQADAYAQKTGDIGIYSEYMDNVGRGEIEYSYFLSTAAGIFVAWTLVAYCIDLGVRTVKLGFYQLIAPIPILTKIIPKQDKIFKNWIKVTLTTFAEVFIRVAVIYFVIFLISSLPNVFSNFWETATLGTPTWGVRLLARVFIILGLLAFAKQAPKLISDITGIDSKNMSLGINIGKKLGENGALAVPTAVGGAFTSGVRRWMNPSIGRSGFGRFRDSISAATRGGYKGAKTGWSAKSFEDVKKGATSASLDAVDQQTKAIAKKAEKKKAYDTWKANPDNAGRLWVEYQGDQFKKWAKSGGVNAQETLLSQLINTFKALEELYKTPKEQSKARIDAIKAEASKRHHYTEPEEFMKQMRGYDTEDKAKEAIRSGAVTGSLAEQIQRYLDNGSYLSEYKYQERAEADIKGIKAVETDAAIRELGKNMERVSQIVENIGNDLSTSGAVGQKTIDALKKVFEAEDKKAVLQAAEFDIGKISGVSELTEQLKKMVTIAKTEGEKSDKGQAALKALKMVVEESEKANKQTLANLQDQIARQKKEEKK